MSIKEFIRAEVFETRLFESQILVVYDPDQRYRGVCQSMASEKCSVVDTTESSIESRMKAIADLGKVGCHDVEQLLVYVPVDKPLDDESKQKDPFSLYAACGAVFPDGDGDSYLSLCLKAKPDHATQIRKLFEDDPSPSFEVIDAVGGGHGWPNLQALLRVESSRDILFALLRPGDKQQEALQQNGAWVAEAKEMFKATIGLKLKTRGKSWSAVADELWRYILFSEFAFDLPGELPLSLRDVPHAEASARPLIEDLCERLRSDRRIKNTYIERAESVETELNLVDACSDIADLGDRDTFPFEERAFLQHANDALLAKDHDRVRQILSNHSQSVWTGKGESQIQWDLLRSALALVEACQDSARVLSDHSRSMDALIDFYLMQLREVDRLHREFEQSVSDYDWQDTQGNMRPVQEQARLEYGKLMESVQVLFTKHLQQHGWPVTNRLSNTEVFDQVVAPRLQQSGHKVAYIMVDALRYELGLALEQQLSEDGKAELQPALAQLPSTTIVGMAGLLPDAGAGLTLLGSDTGITPHINDLPVRTVAQRMDCVKKRYGERFQEGRLEKFVRDQFEVNSDVDLLVLRSVEIDTHFESNPDSAPGEIINALKRIRVAVHKLKESGFGEVVIATDHGFFLNTHAGAGDTCAKLTGEWTNVHDRCLLGKGSGNDQHYLLSAEKAGIRGGFDSIAGPLTLACYQSGTQYFHGGASLQECIVPVITLKLEAPVPEPVDDARVVLSYRSGAKRITTRLPVIEVSVEAEHLFAGSSEFEIMLEAHDKSGEVVGEAKPGGPVDPVAGTIALKPGEKVQITLKMHMEFEGRFKVKALNPSTMTVYDQIDLETDYTV